MHVGGSPARPARDTDCLCVRRWQLRRGGPPPRLRRRGRRCAAEPEGSRRRRGGRSQWRAVRCDGRRREFRADHERDAGGWRPRLRDSSPCNIAGASTPRGSARRDARARPVGVHRRRGAGRAAAGAAARRADGARPGRPAEAVLDACAAHPCRIPPAPEPRRGAAGRRAVAGRLARAEDDRARARRVRPGRVALRPLVQAPEP
mmetsp:Transcript_537/g.1533  ORF Transcript_537/g.1533 Transcript_537/m.1533 type:complete len:204 (+) Transcript_537:267-878(+)